MKSAFRLLCLFNLVILHAQQCMYGDLSNDYGFEIEITRIPRRFSKPNANDSCTIHFKTISKYKSGILSAGTRLEGNINENSFKDCNNSRSYATLKDVNKATTNNDYGDLIVADFNFDGLDDVAVKRYDDPDAIPKYTFFVQLPDCRHFVVENFLTFEVAYFPSFIDNSTKMLTVTICNSTMRYKYDSAFGKWQIVIE